jgi:hypothetical protein
MLLKSHLGSFHILNGTAIYATMGAHFIFADVSRVVAAAFRPISLWLETQWSSGNEGESESINTLGVSDVFPKVGLL